MITETRHIVKTKEDIKSETTRFALGVGLVTAAMIGLWGGISLVNATISNGPLNVLKGYVTAVFG